MKISDGQDCSGGSWEAFNENRMWSLPTSQATNFVSAAFRADSGMPEVCVYSSIIHDSMGPQIKLTLHSENSYFQNDPVKVDLNISDLGIGLKDNSCKLNGNPTACQLDSSGNVTLNFQNLEKNAYFLQVMASDKLGNSSLEQIGWTIKEQYKPVEQKIVFKDSNKVDILLIIDNSPSMSEEQDNMGKRMGTFLNQLKGLDWQVGVTSTDPSDPFVGDGNLIPISNMRKTFVLNSKMDSQKAQRDLSDTIQLGGDGSSSEQGIYATYRAIEHSLDSSSPNKSLFRSDAALAAIVVSDEDESKSGPKNSPENLLGLIKSNWQGQKNFVFHSIIVKPGDQACLNYQETVYGNTYARLSSMTGLGTVGGAIIGSVCEDDYASQLAGIGNSIHEMHKTLSLDCEPMTEKIDILLNGHPYTQPYTRSGTRLSFTDALPAGEYTIKYVCAP
jgi:hypothetical protein